LRRDDVKAVLAYYFGMAASYELLEEERRELGNAYCSLRGTSLDAMPRSAVTGRPTEQQVKRVEELDAHDRLSEIAVREHVLAMDRDEIRGCLDTMKSEHKKVLCLRYRDGSSWARIAVQLGIPDRTVRRWHDRALDRLGDLLEDVPMMEELVARAIRARF